ncbi:MAG: DUF4337 domain-containing protein [Terracidiphilus sp.]|jgi:predicted ribosome quality control (RQC) complex YloA/Tae2 family protein
MEPNEVQELEEQAEHAEHERTLRPVALTMTILAVLVAVVTVLGHRTHTEAILNQDKATDTWGEYQAKNTRSYNTTLAEEIMREMVINDKAAQQKIAKDHADHQKKWSDELKDLKKEAEDLQTEVKQAEAKAVRFDLAEVLLEIGLVITSITLLTRKRAYWYLGLGFSTVGIVAAVLGLLLR